jgi:REP element-mobilizing transposase RayT
VDDEEACVRPNVDANKIINIQSRADTQSKRADTQVRPYVGGVVQWFKTMTTNAYIKMVKNNTCPPFNKRIWQRNYYEHIIRDDVDYERVATYTINNPLTWENDVLSQP